MPFSEVSASALHLRLKELMEQKSKKDKQVFTIYKLAKAIETPYSIVFKLMHEDPEKRVHNPRIDTLIKIVNFFRMDGVAITLDELLTDKPLSKKT